MPLYQFKCDDCSLVFEELTSYDESGVYKGVKCPQCGSEKKEKLISACAFQFKNPEGTDLWRESHDYRFKYNIPNVQKQRAAAEKAAKATTGFTSAKPYNDIDDLKNDSNFGPVK